MGTPTHAVFHQQHRPLSFFLKLQSLFHDFGGVTFLVEVQHEALQRFLGILDGAVVVLESGTVRSPDGQPVFQLFITGFNPPAHVCQPGFVSQTFPFFTGGGHDRCAVAPPYAGKCHIFIFFNVGAGSACPENIHKIHENIYVNLSLKHSRNHLTKIRENIMDNKNK